MTSGWDTLDAFQIQNRRLPKIADAIDLVALQLVRYAPLETCLAEERFFEIVPGHLPPRFRSPRLQLLLRYWMSLANGDVPHTETLRPVDIEELLPNIMIVDVSQDPLRVFYRHVGAEVARFTGLEFTGYYLHEFVMDAFSLQTVEDSYRKILTMRRPGAGIEPFIRDGACELRTEYLMCPLKGENDSSQCIVIEDYFLASGKDVADLVPARWVEKGGDKFGR